MGARLDGRFAYVPSPEGLSGLHVVVVKDACSLPGPPESALPGSTPAASRSRGSMTPGIAAALWAERRFTTGRAGVNVSGAAVTSQLPAEVAPGSTAAGGAQSIRGMAALVVQEEGAPLECSYPQLLRKLGHAGAAAAIIGSVPGSDVTEILCRQGNTIAAASAIQQGACVIEPQCQHGGMSVMNCRSHTEVSLTTECCSRHEECDWEITVPATMIIHEDAQKIAKAIEWFDQAVGHSGTQHGVVADFKTEEVRTNSSLQKHELSI